MRQVPVYHDRTRSVCMRWPGHSLAHICCMVGAKPAADFGAKDVMEKNVMDFDMPVADERRIVRKNNVRAWLRSLLCAMVVLACAVSGCTRQPRSGHLGLTRSLSCPSGMRRFCKVATDPRGVRFKTFPRPLTFWSLAASCPSMG